MSYKAGDRIQKEQGLDISILERVEGKGGKGGKSYHGYYRYHCNVCSHEGKVTFKALRRLSRGCPYCCKNNEGTLHLNSVVNSHPEWLEYFVDKEDGLKSSGSSKVIALLCPTCGYEWSERISAMGRRKSVCPRCAVTQSLPNQFMLQLLLNLQLKVQPEAVFEWAPHRRYDFYLPEQQMIIEMHGAQHYKDAWNRSAKDRQVVDAKKRLLAEENGIKQYIEINCSNVKLSTILAELEEKTFFQEIGLTRELAQSSWKQALQKSQLGKAILLGWKQGLTINEIAENLGYTTAWIREILKRMTEVGAIDYDPWANKRKCSATCVLDKKTSILYESIRGCSIDLDLARSSITCHPERFQLLSRIEFEYLASTTQYYIKNV